MVTSNPPPPPPPAHPRLRRLLSVRMVGEALLGLAWLLAPPTLWILLTQARPPLSGPWVDAVVLMRLGGLLQLLFAIAALLAAYSPAPGPGLASFVVVGAWTGTAARTWLLAPHLAHPLALALIGLDLATTVGLTWLIRAHRHPDDPTLVLATGRCLGMWIVQFIDLLRRPATAAVVILAGALLVAGGYTAWSILKRPAPDPQFARELEAFKHAPLGNENSQGLPLYLWEIMPEVFADKLPGPGGWASFGLLFEDDHPLPVGAALRTNGLPMVSFNCALCHAGSYRTNAQAAPTIVAGAPATRLDLVGMLRFFGDTATDPRFNADTLLPRIESRHQLGSAERFLYRTVVIPVTRASLQIMGASFDWTRLRPEAGPGRTDAINILKQTLIQMPDDGSIGTTDYMSLWDQKAATGQKRGWNGVGSVDDANLFAAGFLTGFNPGAFHAGNYQLSARLLQSLRPPPFPGPIDTDRARRGAGVFSQQCASCHGPGGARTGQITPVSEVGTDEHYLRTWRPDVVAWLGRLSRPPFVFPGLKLVDGFANLPLDGIWLRAPYLHNGSVPTLWDLLQPPALRPATFPRGDDLCDTERVGLGTAPTPGGSTPARFLYDTRLLGNSNAGHSFGTSLPEADKRDLLEYLKTL